MIEAVFFENESHELEGFQVAGHAGYAPAGEDIVCAGVSALVQAAVCGLEKFLSTPPDVQKVAWGEENIVFKVVLSHSLSSQEKERAKVILETLELGLTGIAKSYPDYIRVRRAMKSQ
ncbi:MAG: Uncharacterized protein XD63_0349 [Thermoanaerobacterales bacterium 50_218]|nr:MAG: Uncharacterized protein XD63_0349 [Thermoanaerobacterales bacterium 50_218]HAA90771.1 ribosomal-processing cysteine protease Prp [Peptococcaceae bacterium]